MKNEDGKGAHEGEQSRGKQEGKKFYKTCINQKVINHGLESTDLNSRVG